MITKEVAIDQLRSVFDQIVGTGGVKTMKDAVELAELFKAISGYLDVSPTLAEMPT